MKLHCIFIACLALFALCTLALDPNAKGPDKCCMSFYNMRIPVKQVVGYQITVEGCDKKGIIFITESGKEICADPNERWVQRLKKMVDGPTLQDMTDAKGPDKCCFSFSNLRRIPVRLIVGYQTTVPECQNEGIIFNMDTGKEICADLNMKWVQDLKNMVDARALKD